ncbi:hypothetical protein FRC08_002447 [Ceratobasidium sp. 394]|nr:hypothetical protein FRC08_002447 [Ceratobasidium sp. 394]
MIKTAKETTSFDTGVRLTGFSVFDPASQTYTVTPKEYGKSIKTEQLPEGTARFFAETVPRESLLKVLGAVHSKLLEIQQALAETEIRMVGGSVLIVWEGDPTALARAIETADSGRDVMEESDDEGDEELEESARKPGPVYVHHSLVGSLDSKGRMCSLSWSTEVMRDRKRCTNTTSRRI